MRCVHRQTHNTELWSDRLTPVYENTTNSTEMIVWPLFRDARTSNGSPAITQRSPTLVEEEAWWEHVQIEPFAALIHPPLPEAPLKGRTMMGSTTGEIVPLELQEAIIDNLRHDKKNLAITSRVCRNWRLRSYKYVFSTMNLTTTTVFVYAMFLRNPFSSSAIFHQVQRVRLGPANCTFPWDRSHVKALHDILACLSTWKNVTHFSITRVRWPTVGLNTLSFICNNFKMISTLHLSAVWFSSPAEFVDLILSFPRLKYSIFQDIECLWAPNNSFLDPSFSSTSYNNNGSPFLPPGSYSCSFRVQENHTLRKDVRWTRYATHLSVPLSHNALACLAAHASVHNIDISTFIRTLGSSLHHLEVTSPFQNLWAENLLQSLDLSRTTALKEFSAGSPARVLTLLPWIVTILSQLPYTSRPTLRVLQIAFASSQQFFLDIHYLRGLASVLSQSQFENLQVIHFVAFGDSKDDKLEIEVEQGIREHLSYWCQKGALRFTFPSGR